MQSLADNIGCQKECEVLFASDEDNVEAESPAAKTQAHWCACAHHSLDAVRKHIKLAIKEVSTRQEAMPRIA